MRQRLFSADTEVWMPRTLRVPPLVLGASGPHGSCQGAPTGTRLAGVHSARRPLVPLSRSQSLLLSHKHFNVPNEAPHFLICIGHGKLRQLAGSHDRVESQHLRVITGCER